MQEKDGLTPFRIRQGYWDVIVEPARAFDGWVDSVETICGADNDYAPALIQAIQQNQQLGYKRNKGAIASSSSIRIMLGASACARPKTSRRFSALWPTHLERISGPLISSKCASLSVATALASSVFPLPGGPQRMIPRCGVNPRWVKYSACFRGSSQISRSCSIASS